MYTYFLIEFILQNVFRYNWKIRSTEKIDHSDHLTFIPYRIRTPRLGERKISNRRAQWLSLMPTIAAVDKDATVVYLAPEKFCRQCGQREADNTTLLHDWIILCPCMIPGRSPRPRFSVRDGVLHPDVLLVFSGRDERS